MITWFKMQAGIATNAKVAKAGPDGALVYLAALCQHVQHGRGGRVPAHRMDPDTLRIEAVALLGGLTAKRIAAAFARCVEVGLLRAGGADVVVAGYDADAMPTCVRCHNPNDDHRFATCPGCRAKRTKVDEPRQGATASQNVATCRTGPDRTGPETQSPLPPKGGRASRGGASASRRGVPDPEPETETAGAVATPPQQDAPRRDNARQPAPSCDRSAEAHEAAERRDDGATDGEADPVVRLQEALLRTRYRERLPALKRRFVLRHEAARLVATGLTPDLLAELVDVAAAGDDPGALLAHWLDANLWREVLDDLSAKGRQAAARSRVGESEPLAAGAVMVGVVGVLAAAGGGS